MFKMIIKFKIGKRDEKAARNLDLERTAEIKSLIKKLNIKYKKYNQKR